MPILLCHLVETRAIRTSIAPNFCYDTNDRCLGSLRKFNVAWDPYGAVENSQPCYYDYDLS